MKHRLLSFGLSLVSPYSSANPRSIFSPSLLAMSGFGTNNSAGRISIDGGDRDDADGEAAIAVVEVRAEQVAKPRHHEIEAFDSIQVVPCNPLGQERMMRSI